MHTIESDGWRISYNPGLSGTSFIRHDDAPGLEIYIPGHLFRALANRVNEVSDSAPPTTHTPLTAAEKRTCYQALVIAMSKAGEARASLRTLATNGEHVCELERRLTALMERFAKELADG